LGHYLAGLIESDGSIIVPEQVESDKVRYPSFILVFHLNNLTSLGPNGHRSQGPGWAEKIKEVLGLSTISFPCFFIRCNSYVKTKGQNYGKLTLYSKEGVLTMINLINGKMRTPKIEALHRAINQVNLRGYQSDPIPLLPLDTSPLGSNAWNWEHLSTFYTLQKIPTLAWTVSWICCLCMVTYGLGNSTRCEKLQCLNYPRKFSTNNKKYSKEFCQWLVGFTDGDGSFSIVKSGNTYRLHFGLAQSFYNLRLLYYIKSKLGYGSVTKYNATKVAQLRITDRKVLKDIIFPIFDHYPLLTTKYYNYLKFKEAYLILERKDLNTLEKKKLILDLKNRNIPTNYVSPAISHLSLSSAYFEIESSISILWLIGFIEAEGNFGLFPDRDRFNIEFTLVQKLDSFLLELIKRLLHIPSKVRYSEIRKIHILNTKNSRAISNIIELFHGKFKGMKSLEFKLWCKANYYKNSNPDKVAKIHRIFLKFPSPITLLSGLGDRDKKSSSSL